MAPRRAKPTGKPSFFNATALEKFVVGRGFQAVHASRLWRVVVRALREVDKLPGQRSSSASQNFLLFASTADAFEESKDGDTTKLVLRLRDGHRVEAVAMRHGSRTTVCVSSQVGCAMGCQFCATGTMGIIGDLDASEILEQLAHVTLNECRRGRAAPRNVVFMGMGEPLNNYAVVRAAVEAMCDPFHWGLRKKGVTVSTALRERLVPAARHWPLDELVGALDDHLAKTAKRHSSSSSGMMVEYVLIKGVNDAPAEADALAALFAHRNVYLNIIPYNRNVTAEIHGFAPPDEATARAFGKRIIDAGVRVRLRREYGADIAAACGQLALDSAAAKKSFNAVDIEDAAGGPAAGPAKRRPRTFGPRKARRRPRGADGRRRPRRRPRRRGRGPTRRLAAAIS
ncbi:ribosomal RNA large subunit methyltransferase [Aureococcus anophagefferens]|nr:ribosomal RNA large subunit methyltransferase [Aureococcus anophagefferens]